MTATFSTYPTTDGPSWTTYTVEPTATDLLLVRTSTGAPVVVARESDDPAGWRALVVAVGAVDTREAAR